MAHAHAFHPISVETDPGSPYLLAGCRACSETRRACARCAIAPAEQGLHRRLHEGAAAAGDENQWAKAELIVRDPDLTLRAR
jgi:hypothetical protein